MSIIARLIGGAGKRTSSRNEGQEVPLLVNKQALSCVATAKGPIGAPTPGVPATATAAKEVSRVMARVGKPAPDFEASAFIDGGFKNIKLSDYKGKWVVLCFYPGDFTFV